VLGATLDSPSRRAPRTHEIEGIAPVHRFHLAPRFLQLAALACEGNGYKEIGEAMGLTAGTVKVYGALAMRSSGARNRTQLAVWYDRGYFDPPPVDCFPGVELSDT